MSNDNVFNKIGNKCTKVFSVLLLLFLTGCSVKNLPKKIKGQPNVVFIICDDLNDYSSVFGGHPQAITPHMDELANSGTTFVNAFSNTPVCSPSRNSLFTGVYSHVSRDFGWTKHFEQKVLKHNKTMMELFAENGYHVTGSGKLLHVNRKEYWHEWGVDINNYGPLAFNGHTTVGHPSVPKPFRDIGPIDGSFAPLSDVPSFPDSVSGGNRTGWVYHRNKKDFLNYNNVNDRDLLPDEMHAEWAESKIKSMEKDGLDQPFFMAVGFVRPHTPLYAPKKYFDIFPIDEIQLPKIIQQDVDDTHYKDIYPADIKGLRYYRTLKESYDGDIEKGLKHFIQAYLACVAFVDDQIGRVVDAVNNSEFKDNTIIVLTSDHGWQMGEKEYIFKNSPWEESTRIPMIIKYPDSEQGTQVNQPVSLIDLFPTLIDLCSLEGDHRKNENGGNLGGYSLEPFLFDKSTSGWKGPKGALSMVGVGLNKNEVHKQTYSYRTEDWRYILYMNGKEELYDHRNDPFEWQNLAEEENYTEQKKELRMEMEMILNKDENK
jgi:arylsulfatase A-like enzyme